MKDIIKKIIPANLRQKLVSIRAERIDRMMCKSFLWATKQDARVLGMPKKSRNWGDYWVIKHLERLSLCDKILLDVGSNPTIPLLEFYVQKVRHAYQIDFQNKKVLIENLKRLSVLRTDSGKPLPLPDASVDMVIGTRIFSYLSLKDGLFQIKEIFRLLRPGGKAFLTIIYFFGQRDSHSVLPGKNDSNERIVDLETNLNLISALKKMHLFRFNDNCNPSLFPGTESFGEERVLSLPGLITYSPGDFEKLALSPDLYKKDFRCAEIGIVLEKPSFHQFDNEFAQCEDDESGIYRPQKQIDIGDSLDDRTSCLLSFYSSIAGKRLLCLYDDGSDFTRSLETAGATVHSCVSNMDAYHYLKNRYPERKCWIHDLNYPWSLNIGERYDAVLAFNVLHRLSNPKPFLKYVTQLGPVLFVDVPCDFDSSEIKNTIDPIFLKDQMQLFDVEAHQFPKTIFYDKKHPRQLFICRRQRDNLEPMIVHVHMPKAAGQAFEEFLSQIFPGRVKRYYPEEPAAAQWELFKREIQNESSPVVFSSQSMSMYFPPILGNRIMLYVSFFRHPFSMVFSYVKYIKKNYETLSAAHKAILPDNLRLMSIEESVKWHIRNGGFFPLPVLELSKGLGVNRTKEIARRFFFTGIVEEMDRSIKLLSIKLEPYGLHFNNLKMPVKNTTQDVDLEGYDFISDKEFQEFATTELHEEVEFYEWIKRRFEKEAKEYGV